MSVEIMPTKHPGIRRSHLPILGRVSRAIQILAISADNAGATAHPSPLYRQCLASLEITLKPLHHPNHGAEVWTRADLEFIHQFTTAWYTGAR